MKLKILNTIFKRDSDEIKISYSAQGILPVQTIWQDGIFLVGKNKYSKSFKFMDINYAVASKEDKETMFLEYSDLLNSLDTGATAKITINNRRINKVDFKKQILLDMKNDKLDKYRKEYNKMLEEQAQEANGIVQEKIITISVYKKSIEDARNKMLEEQAQEANGIVQEKIITISVYKKSIEDARNYFARIGADLISKFATLGSKCIELDTKERLRILHDFYRTGEETSFRFEFDETIKKGHSFKDFICPDSFKFEEDYFKMGNRFGRVLFLKEYASFIKDSMVTEYDVIY